MLKAGIQMISGLVIARFIAPDDYGIWGLLTLAITYSSFLQLGIINGVNLELPISLGKNNMLDVKRIIGTSQVFISSCLLLLFSASIFYLIINWSSLEEKMLYGIITIILITMCTFYQDFLTATFRTPNSFLQFSKINFFHSFVNLISVALIFYFGYYGLLLKSLIVIVLYVLLLHIYRPIKVKSNFSLDVFIKLVKTGLPIFSLAYIQVLAIGVDRVLLVRYGSMSDVGIYSFAYLAFSSITLMSGSVASYIYPTMTHMFAENRDYYQLSKFIKKNISIVFGGLLIVGSIGYLLVPSLIVNFFPYYIDSIYVMKILIFAGVFQGSVIGVNVLLSMKKWKLMVIYQLIFSILLLCFPVAMIFLWPDNVMHSIAIGVLIANIANFFNAYIIVYFALKVHP